MSILFGNNRGSGGRNGGGGGSSALVEFRAGKMSHNKSTNLVSPDKRKGLVYIEQGSEDSLMHFKWKDRSSGIVEDDLIIFPDDIEFKAVPQCTTGRVFLLKFKSSSKKMFFWMQEPKDEKDSELCKKVNELLNNPPSSRSAGAGSAGGAASRDLASIPGLDLNNLQDSELQNLLSNMSQQQLMQFFGGSGGSGLASLISGASSEADRANRRNRTRSTAVAARSATSTPVSAASATASAESGSGGGASSSEKKGSDGKPIQLEDLQSILSGIQGGGTAASNEPNVDLSSSINVETLIPLLENQDFVKKMKEFVPQDELIPTITPESAADEIKSTVRSPQFQQALSMFSVAFQSAQLAPLIREFDLGDEAVAAATAGNMEQFIKALQNAKKKTDDKPEDMALD